MTPLDLLTLMPAAFIAGLLMFLAPCTLPIVPGYLAFIAGVPEGAASTRSARRRVLINAIAFVIGFSIVFILLGTFAVFIGAHVAPWRDALSRVGGFIIIIFGLTMLGVVRIPVLSVEKRIAIPHFLTIGKVESSALIGVLFALGWSPCVGPILGSIFSLVLLSPTPITLLQGALLLAVFSLGLGLPFIGVALLLERAGALISRYSAFVNLLSIVGGVMLILLGILMLLGDMGLLVAWGFGFFDSHYSALLQYM